VAQTFNQLIREEDIKKIKEPYFSMASENYKTIQIHKNLEEYLNTDNN